jgi:hypothetical protein
MFFRLTQLIAIKRQAIALHLIQSKAKTIIDFTQIIPIL